MNHESAGYRLARAAVLFGLIGAAAGCSWFRTSTDYQQSPESRPLEVPPDLDAPRADTSMQIPAVAAPRPVAVGSAAFTIEDSVESAWRRVGLALERVDGVVIAERAQALSAYNVKFGGEEFLLRVVGTGNGSRVEAVGSDGQPRNEGAAARLLGTLKSRLG